MRGLIAALSAICLFVCSSAWAATLPLYKSAKMRPAVQCFVGSYVSYNRNGWGCTGYVGADWWKYFRYVDSLTTTHANDILIYGVSFGSQPGGVCGSWYAAGSGYLGLPPRTAYACMYAV